MDKDVTVVYYQSPRGGTLAINDHIVDTKSDTSGWRYIQMHLTKAVTSLNSLEGENAVAAISAKQAGAPTYGEKLLGTGRVSYTKIDTTSYTVSISGKTTNPKLLIFNENYNPGWELTDGKAVYKPILVNTWANGYVIPGAVEGNLSLVLSGQRSYFNLLIASIITFFLLLSYPFIIFIGQRSRRIARVGK
jgi:hypothetical protein